MNIRKRVMPHGQPVRILKALAHPARLQMLLALRESDACVCELSAWLAERQPYVS